MRRPLEGAAIRTARFPLVYLATWLALFAFSAAAFLTPLIGYAVIAPNLDHVINTATIVVAGSVVVRTWIRFADGGDNDTLYQSAAFLALFVGGLTRLLLSVTGSPLYDGYRLDMPDQAPLYVWTLQRLVAGILLLLGAMSVIWRWPRVSSRSRWLIAFGPAAVVLALTIFLLEVGPRLPGLIPQPTLSRLIQPQSLFDPSLVSIPYALTQVAIVVMFTLASLGYARLSMRTIGRPENTFLSIALAIAAFSEIHYALVPGAYDSLLTSGDYLRLAFYITVLAGAAIGEYYSLRRLRQANADLADMQTAEADRRAMIERARLAREVHDGLVQELWLARLTENRLLTVPNLPAEARTIVHQLDDILDRAVAESRQAVVTLQAAPGASFGELLERFVEDYGDRFGLSVECTVKVSGPTPDAETQGELMRITREAMNNVHKHADATVTRVSLVIDDSRIILSIHDNGAGFDPEHVREGFGLQSMRDRAAEIGADLRIVSRPMDGTTVIVEKSQER